MPRSFNPQSARVVLKFSIYFSLRSLSPHFSWQKRISLKSSMTTQGILSGSFIALKRSHDTFHLLVSSSLWKLIKTHFSDVPSNLSSAKICHWEKLIISTIESSFHNKAKPPFLPIALTVRKPVNHNLLLTISKSVELDLILIKKIGRLFLHNKVQFLNYLRVFKPSTGPT